MTLRVKRYKALATAYYPTSPATHTAAEQLLEGGDDDRRGFPLKARAINAGDDRPIAFTVQQFLRGRAPFAALAMAPYEQGGPRYGTPCRIPELEAELNGGRPITFLVVDTGDAFQGKGRGRVDICFDDRESGERIVGNMRPVTLVFMEDAAS